jgi:heptosyltransferase-1
MGLASAAPRILILRLSAIGDVAMASGILPALRSRWPQAHIAWLVEPAAAPLLAHNPRLDELIVWPRAEWLELWRARRLVTLFRKVMAFRHSLRLARFDVVLDLQGLLKSAVWGWLSSAPERICLRGREGAHLLSTERLEPPPGEEPKRMGSEYRYLARHLGAAEEAFQPDIAVGDSARLAAHAALASSGIDVTAKTRYAVLCPFTTRPQKHWFEERWIGLAHRLRESGFTPVLLGGPADGEAAARIAKGMAGIANLVGTLKLDESVAVIADAALLIGVDTGLTHVGSALGLPTVALFGSTCPYLDPVAPRSAVLYEKLACSPCRRNPSCDGRFDCMRALEVERVVSEALRVVSLP